MLSIKKVAYEQNNLTHKNTTSIMRQVCYERDNLTNFTLKNGTIELNIITHDIESPKAVLVHIHGIGSHFQPFDSFESMDCFKNRITILDSFVSYAIELRGHGLSSGTRFSINSFNDYIIDLDVLIQYIKQKHDLPIFIIGHSMGATIGVIYTITHKINGIVLLAPMCDLGKELQLSWITVKTFKILSYLFPSYQLVSISSDRQYSGYQKEFIEAKRSSKFQNNEGLRLDISRECYDIMIWINCNSHLVTVPILAFHSKSDKITQLSGTENFLSKCSSTDKTLITTLGEHNLLAPNNKDDPKPKEILTTINQWISDRI
jgi:acylglycerol lipase